MFEICVMRRITADMIFDGKQLHQSPMVLLLHDDGRIAKLVPAAEAGGDVEYFKGLLMPGMVNAHCHLELSHMRGVIPPLTGMVPFLVQVSRQRKVEQEAVQQAMRDAITELENSGVVAVGDVCNTADSISLKAASNIRWHNFIEVFASDGKMAAERMNAALQVQQQFRALIPQHPATVTPHAPYSISPPLFRLLQEAIGDAVATMHNQESAAENELFMQGSGDFLELYRQLNNQIDPFWPSGKSSLQSWLPSLPKPKRLMMVHNVHISEADIDFAQQHAAQHQQQHYYCICIRANQYIQNEVPPIGLLRNKGCTMVIGTDSLASNHSLSMLHELQALQLAFGKQVTLEELLRWATFNGAAALDMDAVLGSFEPGKQPGIMLMQQLQDHAIVSETTIQRIA